MPQVNDDDRVGMTDHASAEQVFVVLPAYNEAACIEQLILDCVSALRESEENARFVVVDDGSADATSSIVERLAKDNPIELVRHPVNRGLGETIRDGLRFAAMHAAPSDIILTLDADGTHEPRYFDSLLKRVREGFDVVIASRYQPGSEIHGVPKHRLWMSDGAGVLFRVLLPIPGVKDYTCGFRAYRASVLKDAFAAMGDGFIDQAGFQCMADILLKLRRSKVRMSEVPFSLRYDLKAGASKMRVVRTVARTLGLIARRWVEN